MSATYGKIFKITIFGESHSESIGVILDGIPSGLELDMDEIFKDVRLEKTVFRQRVQRGMFLKYKVVISKEKQPVHPFVQL